MSHCLTINSSISSPMSPKLSPILLHPRSMSTSISYRRKAIKSMAAQGIDDPGHMERANQQQSQQPGKRSVPVAPIGLWDRFPPARTIQQMMETMDRVMEDPFGYTSKWAESFGNGRGKTPWEIRDAETEYKMRFDMPGMTEQDVEVWVEDKMLVVQAEKLPKDGEEWAEKSYGRYSCRIALPENIQFEEIKAEVKSGVLYISVPKVPKFLILLWTDTVAVRNYQV